MADFKRLSMADFKLFMADFKLFVDAGHGGLDTGCRHGGVAEKTIVLNIAHMVRSILEIAGCQVLMARVSDERVRLEQRVQAANDWPADRVLSIHVNSSGTRPRGMEVLHYRKSINGILLAQTIVDTWRDRLADVIPLRPYPLVPRHNLKLLRKTNMPAVIVEAGFLSNAQDRKLLGSLATQYKVADVLAHSALPVCPVWSHL